MDQSTSLSIQRFFQFAIALAVITGIIMLLDYLSSVLIPFAIAALLAFLLNPLVEFLQHKVHLKSRVLSIITAILVVITVLGLTTWALTPVLADEFQSMKELIKNVVNDSDIKDEAVQYIPENAWDSFTAFLGKSEVKEFLSNEKLGDLATQAAEKVVPGLVSIFSGAFSVILGVVGLGIILLYMVFILIDYNDIMKGWRDLIPPKYKDLVTGVVDDFNQAMGNYFRAQALIALICGILFAIGFQIVGIPLAILLGLFVGMLNLVPYLQTLGFIPAIALAFIHSIQTDQSFGFVVLMVLIVFAVVQIAQDAFLTPKIMGDATGMNPAIILLSLSIWGKILGFLGLIVALPLSFLIITYYKRYLRYARNKRRLEEKQMAQL